MRLSGLRDASSNPTLIEQTFLRRSVVTHAVRLDGRKLNEPREAAVTVRRAGGPTRGARSVAEARVGETVVVCDVSCALVLPYPDRPSEGMFNLSVQYAPSASPLASSGSTAGPPGLANLERVLKDSRTVDPESLCVVAGSRVWSIRCQLVVLNDCGSCQDAASLAAAAALLHFRRPDVTVVGEEVTIHEVDAREPVPLALRYVPLIMSFALIDPARNVEEEAEGYAEDEDSVLVALVDPTEREEAVADGTITIALNAHGEICSLVKAGAPLLGMEDIERLVESATAHRKLRGELLDRAVLAHPFNAAGRGAA